MAAQKSPNLEDAISAFVDLGEMRVWSVLISIFGDVVAPRGGVVSAVLLQTLLECLSIKPEAMRVALHRLVKDGWITRQKRGRKSYYALSVKGQSEFLSATRRIYASKPVLSGPWSLIVTGPSNEPRDHTIHSRMIDAGCIPITTSIFLGHKETKSVSADVLRFTGEFDKLPEWVRNALVPASLFEEYSALKVGLDTLRRTTVSDPRYAAALRVLLIHHWRRLLLRHADLPLEMLPRAWPGETCRKMVLELHAALSTVADSWLDNELAPLAQGA